MHSKHSIIFFTKIFLICILIPHLIKGRKPALLKNIGFFHISHNFLSLFLRCTPSHPSLSPAPDPLLLVFKESCLLRELKATSQLAQKPLSHKPLPLAKQISACNPILLTFLSKNKREKILPKKVSRGEERIVKWRLYSSSKQTSDHSVLCVFFQTTETGRPG